MSTQTRERNRAGEAVPWLGTVTALAVYMHVFLDNSPPYFEDGFSLHL